MKQTISQNVYDFNEKNGPVAEEFTGKRLGRFGGGGLIRRFLGKHHIKDKIEEGVEIEGRRESKYSVGIMLTSLKLERSWHARVEYKEALARVT